LHIESINKMKAFPMTDGNELHCLLSYELASAKRYRRFVSVALLRLPEQVRGLKDVLNHSLRESDMIIDVDQDYNLTAVLMSETDGTGARVAIERFKQLAGPHMDIRIGIATFPFDAGTSTEMLNSVFGRMNKAMEQGTSAVVTCG
jgi:hypothetical protein